METHYFLERVLPRVRELVVVTQSVLSRSDSGFDSARLLFQQDDERRSWATEGRTFEYLVKWNPRKQDLAAWVARAEADLYDYGVVTPLVMWMPHTQGGRVVTDFTSLMDLAPTFLEIAGVPIPTKVDGRSLLHILQSTQSGRVDPSRTFVITGKERHNALARESGLPYPSRAFRTANFLYIRNFAPERWPMGCPLALAANNGKEFVFGDMGRSNPTKDWIIANRNSASNRKYYDWASAKRPLEELYDLRKDPEQINNVAHALAYANIKARLSNRLLAQLKHAGDPRVMGDGGAFDLRPYVRPREIICQDTPPF